MGLRKLIRTVSGKKNYVTAVTTVEGAGYALARKKITVEQAAQLVVPALLAAFLRDELSLAEAGRLAVLATGQYTKRQATWFRRQRIADPSRVHTIHARYVDFTQLKDTERAGLSSFI